MKFGLRYCNTGRYVDGARAVELAQAAEEAGFESMWTVEHTVVPEGYESVYPYSPDGKLPGEVFEIALPDPLMWMAHVGACTSRIRLGTGILILPQHNPVIAAKQVATLDSMTGGRVLLGIGVGWLREEFEVIGAPFEERAARTDEYIGAMRALWSEESPSFEGRFVRFKGAHCRPQPPGGGVPIIVGGHSKAAARRAGRLGDGFFPARGLPEELIALARATAAECGRPAPEITLSCPEDLADIARLEAMGVSRVLVPVTPTPGMAAAVRDPEAVLAWRGRVEEHADA